MLAPPEAVAARSPAARKARFQASLKPTLSTAATSATNALGDHLLFTVALRWIGVIVGGALVWHSTSSTALVVAGIPVAAFAFLRTVEGYVTLLRPGWLTTLSLLVEVAAAAAVASGTGGWHSGWTVTLVVEAAVVGFCLPARLAGQVAAAAVITMFMATLAARGRISSGQLTTIDLDAFLLVAALAVSYASWIGRYGDADRASLARANERLMATNDLLLMLEQTVLKEDDTTDPQQAARAVADLARTLLSPDVVVVASASSVGDTWRVLLAEGVTVGAMIDDLPVLRRLSLEAAAGNTKPVWMEPGEFLSPHTGSAVCIPLSVKGRLIGTLILEAVSAERWQPSDLEMMSELSPWAALLVDNACRFNALWVVGSAEERARVARNLHDSLGQSMAALGLQLDWIARSLDDPEQAGNVRRLRTDVKAMVAELRYTMRDLCCDVNAERGLGEALSQLVNSVAARTGSPIELSTAGDTRIPLAQEHQMLQMARALLGAAVDSRGESITVDWTSHPDGACLAIGYTRGDSACHDQAAPGGFYELDAPIVSAVSEVRDRCWAIGATLECDMERDRCSVRCRLTP